MIVQHESVLEIKSPEVADQLNAHRKKAVDLLNIELRENGLGEVEPDRF